MTAKVSNPTITFADLNLNPAIAKAIDLCGYTIPTPVQQMSIPVILDKKDVVVSAQTGTGKTASFVLPALHHLTNSDDLGHVRTKSPRILILTPTRELATQITKSASLYGKFCRFSIVSLVGGMPYHNQIRDLQRGSDIIVATPGRLIDHVEQKRVDLSKIEILVLDEADRMLDMGFTDDVHRIAELLPAHQTLLFSATVDKKLTSSIRHLMKDPVRIDLSEKEITSDNVKQLLYKVKSPFHKFRVLEEILREGVYKAIIFSATKINADRIADKLQEAGFSAAALHGDLRQNVRNRTLDEFRRGKTQFLVATDVAARGLDVSDITHVINFDLPRNAEDYVHRIGRTGRAGKEGVAISFILQSDVRAVQFIERYIGQRLTLDVAPGPVGAEAAEAFSSAPSNDRSDRSSYRGGKSDGGFKKKSFPSKRTGSAYGRDESDRPSRDKFSSDRSSSYAPSSRSSGKDFGDKRRDAFSPVERKPFGSSDRSAPRSRPFDSERSDRSSAPRGRSFDSDRSSSSAPRSRPFDSERSSAPRGRSFDGEQRRPFGSDRAAAPRRSADGEQRRPFGDRPAAPRGRSADGEQRRSFGSDRPQRSAFGSSDRSAAPRSSAGRAFDGERRQPYTSSSDRPAAGGRPSFGGEKRSFAPASRSISRDGGRDASSAGRTFKKSPSSAGRSYDKPARDR